MITTSLSGQGRALQRECAGCHHKFPVNQIAMHHRDGFSCYCFSCTKLMVYLLEKELNRRSVKTKYDAGAANYANISSGTKEGVS